jgi:hypothetical protein
MVSAVPRAGAERHQLPPVTVLTIPTPKAHASVGLLATTDSGILPKILERAWGDQVAPPSGGLDTPSVVDPDPARRGVLLGFSK